MKRLAFLCATLGLMLGSATPPPAAPEPVRVAAPRATFEVTAFEVLAPAAVEPVAPPVAEPAPAVAPLPAPAAAAPEPATASAGGASAVRVLVSIPAQRAWVFRGRELVATTAVSTGRRGHETPTGTFPILEKDVVHHSNRYNNAPMPYMQRLTAYGIALHGGRLPGYAASHGCIRLPHAFARRLYGLTDYRTRVTITGARPRSTQHALSLAT